jgi:hypothetical protein
MYFPKVHARVAVPVNRFVSPRGDPTASRNRVFQADLCPVPRAIGRGVRDYFSIRDNFQTIVL